MSSPLCGQDSQQVVKVLPDPVIRLPKLLDPLAGVEDRRMVPAAKSIPDLGKTVVREFFGEGHGDLSGSRYGATTLFRQQVSHSNLVVVRHRLLDVVDGAVSQYRVFNH